MPVLKCPARELNLGAVLLSGQSFRWEKVVVNDDENIPRPSEVFIGVAKHRVWKLWRQDDKSLGFEVLARFSKAHGNDIDVLKDYFQLNIELTPLYKFWAENDKHFHELWCTHKEFLEGIRILGQDPMETVFAFICSANNHIRRITNMVEKLCELYGEAKSVFCLKSIKTFHDIVDPNRMTSDPDLEAVLRKHGFGYRASSIALAAKLLQNDGEKFLNNLSKTTYEDAVQELQRMRGVGAKVADCICLMGLRMHHVVPLDTHVLQITAENYLKGLPRRKLVQGKHRQQIASFWLQKFGSYAGWAQAVLFTAHLRRTEIHYSNGRKRRK